MSAYTEFAAKAAAFLLVEVYDSYGMWCLLAEMVRNIRFLDLVQVLELGANAGHLERLLRVIELTNIA